MAKVSGSLLIARALQQEGVSHIFTIAGDHILPVLDVMAGHNFRFIGVRHEEAAVHMADVWARSTGKLGVAMYTTPGFANSLPGLAYALYSEAPVLSISGSAELAELGRGAMQEIDQVAAAKPFVKAAWMVHDPRRIPDFIARAVRLAFSGRRGPVHLTIPVDVQEQEVDESEVVFYPPEQYRPSERQGGDPTGVERAVALLHAAERPYIIAQGPAGYPETGAALQRFIETTHAPLFTEDWVRGLVPDNHPQCFGYFERGLNRAARLLPQADLVMLLGRKQDYTITYLRPPAVAASARIVQIAPDAEAIGLNRGVDVGMVGDVTTVVEQMTAAAAKYTWSPKPWLGELRAAQAEQAKWTEGLAQPGEPMHALYVHRVIGEMLTPDDCLTFDGGDFCHLGRGYHQAQLPRRWWYLPNLGLLGSSLPSAIGAKLANPERRVIAFTGDGAFGFNAMELETAFRERVPVVVVLGNDSTWGIDNGIQIGVYGRGVATDLGTNVRYDIMATGLGAHGEFVERADQLKPALERAFAAAERGQCALVNVVIQRFVSPRAENAINRIKAGLAKHTGH